MKNYDKFTTCCQKEGVRSILWVAVLTCLAMLSKEQVTVITTVVNIIVIIIVTRASQCLLFVWCMR